MEEKDKHIDESWKDAVVKEKEHLQKEGTFVPEEPDFNLFITSLALQASIALGILPNPATNQKEPENLVQAKFIIDTMTLLQEKTKGNLTAEESKMLENLLYELRLQYVAKVEGKK
ncbi:MAG TPA: DUF1844 domain-containing protein [Patescibacteria group bacterium]|nr:DUF1844 domain-containing protein [Patescibacteria group bacterium]